MERAASNVCVIAFCLMLTACGSTPTRDTAPKSEPTLDRVERSRVPEWHDDVSTLIADLGSSDYDTREHATRSLILCGPKIEPLIRPMVESEDPDLAFRADMVLRGIEPIRMIRDGNQWQFARPVPMDTLLVAISPQIRDYTLSISFAGKRKFNREKYRVLLTETITFSNSLDLRPPLGTHIRFEIDGVSTPEIQMSVMSQKGDGPEQEKVRAANIPDFILDSIVSGSEVVGYLYERVEGSARSTEKHIRTFTIPLRVQMAIPLLQDAVRR
jgi:hypothetical protein